MKLKNCKSCGIQIETTSNNKQYCSECAELSQIASKRRARNTLRGHLKHLSCAKGRELLSVEDLQFLYSAQKGLCSLSGVPLTWHHFNQENQFTNISIDRINPEKGYTLDNIQLVCTIVNYMKNTLSETELVWWCKQILQTQEAK